MQVGTMGHTPKANIMFLALFFFIAVGIPMPLPFNGFLLRGYKSVYIASCSRQQYAKGHYSELEIVSEI